MAAGGTRCRRALRDAEKGTSAIEFALVAPLFLLMLMGIFAYGGYFWRAHSLQQVANDAARAAIAGLTATERDTLARAAVLSEIQDLAGIDPARSTVQVHETEDAIEVALNYDARQDVFFQFPFVPMPPSTIRRNAAVRLGGL